jgi:hypothetical protein
MLCKDCWFFKQWDSIYIALCEKFHKQVEHSSRPCDQFVSKNNMTDEWGEQACKKIGGCK